MRTNVTHLLAGLILAGFFLASPSIVRADCWIRNIQCGQTIEGELDIFDCAPAGTWTSNDLYTFHGNAGDKITLTLFSAAFPPTVSLLTDTVDPPIGVTTSAAKGNTAQLRYVLPISGTWTVLVNNSTSPFNEQGPYTLAMQCGAASETDCVPSDVTLCLSSGRFKVEATYDAGGTNAGTARVVRLTGDTGYFWFFASSNVEAVVKILDACDMNQRFWVFAGGLTNVKTVITVTDTETGKVKIYTNPPSTAFKPIQDTGAFATCP